MYQRTVKKARRVHQRSPAFRLKDDLSHAKHENVRGDKLTGHERSRVHKAKSSLVCTPPIFAKSGVRFSLSRAASKLLQSGIHLSL